MRTRAHARKGAVAVGALAVLPLAAADRAEAILPEAGGPSTAPAPVPDPPEHLPVGPAPKPPPRTAAAPPTQEPQQPAAPPAASRPAKHEPAPRRTVRPDIPRAPGISENPPAAQRPDPPRRQSRPRRRPGRVTPQDPGAPTQAPAPPTDRATPSEPAAPAQRTPPSGRTAPAGRTVRPDLPQAPGVPEGWPIGHQPAPPVYGPYATVDTMDAVETTAKRLAGSDDDDDGGWARQVGNRFARGIDVAAGDTREWLDQGPACVGFSYYDRVGAGGGICVDTSEREIQVNSESGVGSGGGFTVDRPDELAEAGYCGLGAAVSTGGGGGHYLVGMDRTGDVYTDSSVYPGFGWRRGRAWPGGLGRESQGGRHTGRPGPWGWTSNQGGRHRANPGARGRLGGYLGGTAQGKVYVTCGDVLHY